MSKMTHINYKNKNNCFQILLQTVLSVKQMIRNCIIFQWYFCKTLHKTSDCCYNFFVIGRQFWGFGNRPMIGRWSADDRPISRPMSYSNESHIIGRCVGRPSADHRPTIGRSSLATYHRPMCRPTIGRL